MRRKLDSHWRLFLYASLAIALVALVFVWSDYRSYRERSLITAKAEVNRFDLALSRRLEYVIQDVLFLAGSDRLIAALQSGNVRARQNVADSWLQFSTIKRVYDQIRWIDETGQERIRVNLGDEGAYAVAEDRLQNKKGRYYFDDTFALGRGQVGISPLDLNVEQGQIEQPLKPMIRIGTPVFDEAGNKRGILIINYLADNLLDLLSLDERDAWLVNAEGYWLHNEQSALEWGFMYGRPALTMAERHPAAWQRISTGSSGDFVDGDGVWAFTTISPLQHAVLAGAVVDSSLQGEDYAWKLIRFYPESDLTDSILQMMPRYLGVTGILLLLAFIATRYISRARAAELQAHQRLTLTQYALGEAGIGVLWVDRETGALLFVNEHASSMLGYRVGELLELGICDVVVDLPPEEFPERATMRFAGGRAHFETRMRTRDGRVLPVEVVGFEVASVGGPGNLICFVSDITARRAMEEQLREARDEAEASSQAKSAFLANMSHEIRTPMNAVLGYAYLLSRLELPADAQALVSKIRNSGTTLLGIISDILDFSKIESGKLTLESVPFHLGDVQRTVANVMSAQALSRSIELVITPPPAGIDNLIGDPLRLGQILINLTGNAIKFTERGHVHVDIELLDESDDCVTLRFAVIDTGIGIAEDRQQEIFKAFSQADVSTTRRFGGTGLGLSICAQLVHQMGGEIGVVSTPDEGSEFWFTLTLPKGEPEQRGSRDVLTVLIADDNDTAREALAQTVDRIGWRPLCVESGEAATRLAVALPETPPNVILLDWKMPGMDGLEAARTIRASNSAGAGPIIIMVTSYMREDLLREPGSQLVDAVLEKPVTISSLHDTVAGLLQQKLGRPQTAPLGSKHRRLAGLRTLVVDDSETNREVAQGVLSQEGAQVVLAANGQLALDWLQAHPDEVDVVLMDVQMPVLDGLQATRQLRAMPQFADLPVVAMTAGVFKEQKDEAMAAGMNGYIAKPLDVDATIATLQRVVRWTQAPVSAVAEYAAGLEALPVSEIDTSVNVPGISLFHAASVWKSAANYRRFLRKFASEHRGFMQELDDLQAQGALEDCTRSLHKMYGAAGNLGLLELAACAQELEQSLRAGDAGVSARAALALSMQAALVAITTYTGPDEEVPAEAGRELEPAARQRVAELLQQALDACDTDNPEPIVAVLAELAGLLPAGSLQPLQAAVDDYDFRCCEERVRSLATSLQIEPGCQA